MRSYEAARTYFSVLEFFSWAVILLGAIIAIIATGDIGEQRHSFSGPTMIGWAGLILGCTIMFLGFLGLVGVQIGRAGVDSAEYAQQGLKVARDQLEVSRQALKQGAVLEKGYAALQAAKQGLREGAEPATAPPSPTYADAKPLDEPDNAKAHPPLNIIDYRGMRIEERADGYYVESSYFAGLNAARKYIDRQLGRAAALPLAPEDAKPDANQTSTNIAPKVGGATRT